MPLREDPAQPRTPDTEELRLALVCYGGVSLAIWMHGVTKELHNLVLASERHDADPSANPFPDGSTEHVYWDLLAERAAEGVRTRVVVDIVAGTSAGGINGIVLAKALACGGDQAPVTRVWLDQGDLSQLMRSWPLRKMPGPQGKAAAWVLASAVRGFKPPLRGDLLLALVSKALDEMDATAPGHPVSPDNPVELHVTMTDFRGYDHAVPADSPASITDRRHRHVLSFRAGRGEPAELGRDYNRRLAFAARATSSFPGAFEPVRLDDLARVLGCSQGELDAFRDEQWRIYDLSRAEVGATQLVDGGVLDNAPFKLAIEAIQGKPAATEVRRRLVFIQPDPPLPAGGADASDDAGFAETVWGSVSGLPRHEPMLDDLLELQAFNERVDRVAAIMEAAASLAAPDADGDANRRAREEAGFAYTSYVVIKLHGVVERFARIAARLCRFPRESAHTAFVRAVMLLWAQDGGLLATRGAVTPQQEAFLSTFDLDYGERRLRYVIRQVSDLYGRGDVDRAELNALKGELYENARKLWLAVESLRGTAIEADARALFDPEEVHRHATGYDTPDEGVAAFLETHRDELVALRDAVGAHLDRQLDGFGAAVRATLARVDAWPAQEAAAAVREAYERFPYWDLLLYPIRKASETAELDRVRVMRLSPYEATLLTQPGTGRRGPAKLEGVKAGHFGAFFSRARRENDYLWGRLDAAEWIVTVLRGGAKDRARCAAAFSAVLASEEGLRDIRELRATLAEQVDALAAAQPAPAAAAPG